MGRAVPVKRPALLEAEVAEAADEEEVSQEELFPPSRGKPKVKRSMVEELELPLPPPRPVDEALPPLDLLDLPKGGDAEHDEAVLQRLGELLLATLKTFKVEGTLAGITSGPTVSQFEVVPASGVKAGRIVALADDLAITMRAQSLRVAPIPGRGAVGVEIPESAARRMVTLRELLASEAWRNSTALLPIAIGRDVEGKPVVADLAKMPHLLVAGATGSGKSVAINTIVTSLDLSLHAARAAAADGRPEDGRALDVQRPAAPAPPGRDRQQRRGRRCSSGPCTR